MCVCPTCINIKLEAFIYKHVPITHISRIVAIFCAAEKSTCRWLMYSTKEPMYDTVLSLGKERKKKKLLITILLFSRDGCYYFASAFIIFSVIELLIYLTKEKCGALKITLFTWKNMETHFHQYSLWGLLANFNK